MTRCVVFIATSDQLGLRGCILDDGPCPGFRAGVFFEYGLLFWLLLWLLWLLKLVGYLGILEGKFARGRSDKWQNSDVSKLDSWSKM